MITSLLWTGDYYLIVWLVRSHDMVHCDPLEEEIFKQIRDRYQKSLVNPVFPCDSA